jgi:hypothetical protein
MNINKIKFSHNWNNKLSNDVFTTIRRYEPAKARYYQGILGMDFDVILNDKKVGEAILRGVTVTHLNKVPMHLLFLDTGFIEEDKAYQVFKDFGLSLESEVLMLLFERKAEKWMD